MKKQKSKIDLLCAGDNIVNNYLGEWRQYELFPAILENFTEGISIAIGNALHYYKHGASYNNKLKCNKVTIDENDVIIEYSIPLVVVSEIFDIDLYMLFNETIPVYSIIDSLNNKTNKHFITAIEFDFESYTLECKTLFNINEIINHTKKISLTKQLF